MGRSVSSSKQGDTSASTPPAKTLADQPRRSRWPGMPLLIKFCVITMAVFVTIGALAPLIAPHDPVSQSLIERLTPPAPMEDGSSSYILGTDQLGRDVLSRIIYGARISLSIGVFGMTVGLLLGSTIGVIAGFSRGMLDETLMFLVDVQLALPFIIIALAAIAIFGPSLILLLAIVGIAGWEGFARIARGMVLSASENQYVLAAHSIGATRSRIILRHIVPNIVAPLIVFATLNLTVIILLESTLSFLGVGVQPPLASWGSMIGSGRDYLSTAWWIAVFPGTAIVMVTMSISLFGDWLRDFLDPTLKGR